MIRIARRLIPVLAVLALAACAKPEPKVLTFSIVSTEATQTQMQEWGPFLKDMQASTGLTVKPFFGSNYSALIEAMRFKQSDLGWVHPTSPGWRLCAGPAARCSRGPPIPTATTAIRRVIIVKKGSGITLDQLLKCGCRPWTSAWAMQKSTASGRRWRPTPTSSGRAVTRSGEVLQDRPARPSAEGEPLCRGFRRPAGGHRQHPLHGPAGGDQHRPVEEGAGRAAGDLDLADDPRGPDGLARGPGPGDQEEDRRLHLQLRRPATFPTSAKRQRGDPRAHPGPAPSATPTTPTSCRCARWRRPASWCRPGPRATRRP